ncbi:MAG: BrnA antitoxin family protein [Acidobacteriia bacterium]|nr:BrnA antitoxin family protein [Terriglobia bacterium]
MKEKRTGRTSINEGTDWKRLRSLNDRQIRRGVESDPEARPTDAKFWKKARVVIPAAKQTITIRLDADLLEWLRKQKGYQTRINAVLRTYMDASLTSGRRG